MKKLMLLLLVVVTIFADDTQTEHKSFFSDIVNELDNTINNANISDKVKLENMQNYIKNLQFNDKVDKSKYNFNIMGNYENYMLLGGYSPTKLIERHWSNAVEDTYKADGTTFDQGYERDSNEAQFQLSIKVPLYSNFLNTGADLFTGYTQNSYWQVYNTEHSSPFRETNYMPELFLQWNPNKTFGESKLIQSRFSLIHQSNGQDVGKSRSWNRTEIFFLFQHQNIFYGFNAWDRWNEDKKDINDPDYPDVTEGDDNVGLEDYIGKERVFVKYKSKNYSILLAHQNNIFDYHSSKGNTKIDITFPSINSNFDFFIRYFSGYGESLIDYDVKLQRISFGIMIANWI